MKTCAGHGGDEHQVAEDVALYNGLCAPCVEKEVRELLALSLPEDTAFLELPPAWVEALLDLTDGRRSKARALAELDRRLRTSGFAVAGGEGVTI